MWTYTPISIIPPPVTADQSYRGSESWGVCSSPAVSSGLDKFNIMQVGHLETVPKSREADQL